MSKTPLTYCINLVKRLDYEGYIATLFYPKEARSAAFTIRALNLELAQAYHSGKKDRKLASLRLQFWSDAVESICKLAKNGSSGSADAHEKIATGANTPAAPVCMALAKYATDHRLPEYWLKRLVSARLSSSNESFATMDDLERYAEDTQATTNYLMLHILGIKEMSADMAARHIGKATTIMQFIRTIPHYARLSVPPGVPESLIAKHKVSKQALMKGKTDANMRAAIFEMADVARGHFEFAADLRKKIKVPARLLYLPAEPLERYFGQLKDANYDPFDLRLLKLEAKRNNLLPLRFWIMNYKNKRLK